MSAMQQHPSTRDAALRRGRRLAWTAGLGGLAAVGTITGMLANAAASTATPASTGVGGNAATQPGDAQQQPGDSQQAPSDSQNNGSLLPPQSQPGRLSGGGLPNAVSGGSGHR